MKYIQSPLPYLVSLRAHFRFIGPVAAFARHQLGETSKRFCRTQKPEAGRSQLHALARASYSTRQDKAGRTSAVGTDCLPPGARPGDPWLLEHVRILLQYTHSVPPGAHASSAVAISLLGWSHLPDPDKILWRRVKRKLGIVRNLLSHGRDPLDDSRGLRQPDRYHWRRWLALVFQRLPNCEGTMPEVAALVEADPEIAPHLDKANPNPRFTSMPRWRSNMANRFYSLPEIINTGKKRDGCYVYRWDEEIARRVREGEASGEGLTAGDGGARQQK
ncbi:hypothetical protein Agub_g13404 [Astrephomene gubernaculifera]|uniref:Uncharacterized protein n=1 Tax=Astrephomene gubernaculifera TaxID=47775 RepID=A0AAD3HS28_9CHLO|nr:hypothetical protein Agub_g13404 [Astrephomene gubernaculifera]